MNKRGIFGINWLLVIPVFSLLIISLITLFSLNFDFFKSQLIFLILSFFVFLFFSQVNCNILRHYSFPIYIISIVVLVLVLLIGIESRGSVRWIEFLGFRIQFTEVLKPFLSISLASYIASRKELNFKEFFNILVLLGPLGLLIFFQPDLGNAILYGLVVLATLIYAGFSIKYFFFIFIPMIASIPILWNFLHDYQKQRVLTFIDPSRDPLGTSYNVIQSIIAVGSGMIMGRGIGEGTQSSLRFLPERQTDFIFATISEQLGFIGTSIILLSFAFLLYRVYKIFQESENKFTKTFSAVVFFSFLVQIFVNIGMNVGLLPIVGVTLPFVSYGGSSLLSNFIFLGLLASIGNSSRKREILEIR